MFLAILRRSGRQRFLISISYLLFSWEDGAFEVEAQRNNLINKPYQCHCLIFLRAKIKTEASRSACGSTALVTLKQSLMPHLIIKWKPEAQLNSVN
ncbi:hypothetical protein B0J14DRAFT_144821 [Halenospora varia]|nr:hypothetical protein B0J14DRAFT_144821 [Halenospora varia]